MHSSSDAHQLKKNPLLVNFTISPPLGGFPYPLTLFEKP